MTSLLLSKESAPPSPVPQPRFVYQPPTAVGSFGDEAIALARLAGLELDEWQCDALRIMLSFNSDGQWTCPDYVELVARQNGKGAILEARALAGLFLLGEKLICWTAHETKTTDEAFLRFKSLIDKLIEEEYLQPGDIKERQTNGQNGFLILKTKQGRKFVAQRLKFIARSKGSGRGFSGDCVIIDEAYDYTPAQAAALEPTMLSKPNPQTIYTSTPPLSGDTGQPLYDLRERAEAGADPMLGYRDWGLGGWLDEIELTDDDGNLIFDVSDEANWAKTNPALGGRMSWRELRRLRRKLGLDGFARESLGIWPRRTTAAPGAITIEEWEALADPPDPSTKHPGSRRAGDITMMLEVNATREWGAIGIAGLRLDGLMHWELIEYRRGTDWMVSRAVELATNQRPIAVGINGKGAAASLIPRLVKAGIAEGDREHPLRGELVILGPNDMADAFGMFVDAVRQKRGRHRDQSQLNSAVAGAKTRPLGDNGMAWQRRDGGSEISPVVTVTGANWLYETRAHLLVEDLAPNFW